MKSNEIDFDFLPIYIIHCDGNDERYKLMQYEIQKNNLNNIKIINAVTPENIHLHNSLKKYYDIFDLPYTDKRSACCAFSHYIVNEIAQTDGHEYFMILEDDFKILENFEFWKKEIKNYNFDFDLIIAGGFFDSLSNQWVEKVDNNLHKINQVNCSVANIFTKETSKYFIDAFNSFYKKQCFAADSFYHRYVYSKKKCISVLPLPISVHPTISSINLKYIDHATFYKELNRKNNE